MLTGFILALFKSLKEGGDVHKPHSNNSVIVRANISNAHLNCVKDWRGQEEEHLDESRPGGIKPECVRYLVRSNFPLLFGLCLVMKRFFFKDDFVCVSAIT